MTSLAESFLEASIRTATPLALAALGETVVQRAGVINIGLEGVILAGAFGALVGGFLPPELHAGAAAALGSSVAAGYTLAILAGVLTASIFALFAVSLKGDQIITGTAINLLVLGSTGTLYRILYGAGGAALSVQTSGSAEIPVLSDIPLVGRALFAQPFVTYGLYLLIPVTWWALYRTHAGLALRAVGENPEAAAVAGVSVMRTRWTAILIGGALGGGEGKPHPLCHTKQPPPTPPA
ncbi:MAG: ABC transporter permease, partial [Gemmatimonadaceae bacterium]